MPIDTARRRLGMDVCGRVDLLNRSEGGAMLQRNVFACSRKGHSIRLSQANGRRVTGTGIAQGFEEERAQQRGSHDKREMALARSNDCRLACRSLFHVLMPVRLSLSLCRSATPAAASQQKESFDEDITGS